MKKWFYVLLAAVILAAAIPLAGCSGSKSEEPYKIGALFAVTGGNAPLGEPEKQTVDMMVESINNNGGINGHHLEVISYDYESDATKCATDADALINDDKVVAIIGPTGTGDTNGILEAAMNAQIPLISCAAGVTIVTPNAAPATDNDRHWIFSTPQVSVMVVQRLYTYLQSKNITRIAILTDTLGFGKDGLANLNGQAAAYGITIAYANTFGETDADMNTQLTAIRDTSNAQAVVCWGTSPGPAIIARNMASLGITIPLFCSHGIAFQSFIDTAGSAANGVIFPCGKLPVVNYLSDNDPQKSLLLQYRDDFNNRYGNGKANTFGGHAYDALNMVVTALKNGVTETPDQIKSSDDTLQTVRLKIRDYIEENINSTGFSATGGFPGIGGVFNMSPITDSSPLGHNGLAMSCLVMVKIANGKWTLAE